MSKRSQIILLCLIFIISFILRFWNFPDRYVIGSDSSRDALVSFESARQLQLPLTGSFSSIGPITFGPWYYYYIIASIFIIPSVWAPWLAIGLTSFAMVIVMYKIGEILESKNFGLLLAFIASLSPAQIVAASVLQQHALIGFLSAIVIYIFLKILKVDRPNKFAIFWGLTLGFAINTHFQAIGLLTLPVLYLLITKKYKFLFSFLIGFFISMIPILIFELNNHWFNTKNIVDYIRFGQYRVWTSNRWLTFIGDFIPDFWSYTIGLPSIICGVVIYTSGFLLSRRAILRKLNLSWLIISISFLVQIIILRYYRGEKFFGYLQFFHPYIFIFSGYVIYLITKKIRRKLVIFLFLGLYLLLTLPNSVALVKSDKFNRETSARILTLKKELPGTKFATFECIKVYDTDRIQGLLLYLYMNKLYDENGRKIAIYNPACRYNKGKVLTNELIDLDSVAATEIREGGLIPMTPLRIYNETARWWFKEQP